MGKSYKGRISEENYSAAFYESNQLQDVRFLVIITDKEKVRVESLFEEYVDDGKVYQVTIEEIQEEPLNISRPLTAEWDLVPA